MIKKEVYTEGRTDGKGAETKPCGCVVERVPGSRTKVRRCPEAEALWGELIAARDAQREAGMRPAPRITAAFVTARSAYQLHMFGEVVG